jgi:uracil-DNA glycosylase family 4
MRVAEEESLAIKTGEFEILQKQIIECRKCPRLVEWRERTAREKVRRFLDQEYWARPIPAFGDPVAFLVIVGLAPAAHGGNRTGRMFTGDRSGDWLFEALHRFGFANQPSSSHRHDGLSLRDAIIIAAVRCAPPGNKPLPEEMNNCGSFLRQELRLLISAKVVVTLGQIAFRAFLAAWRENGNKLPAVNLEFSHGGEWELPGGVTLISSYHPSQQNTLTGKLTRLMFHRIFRRARRMVEDSRRPSGLRRAPIPG